MLCDGLLCNVQVSAQSLYDTDVICFFSAASTVDRLPYAALVDDMLQRVLAGVSSVEAYRQITAYGSCAWKIGAVVLRLNCWHVLDCVGHAPLFCHTFGDATESFTHSLGWQAVPDTHSRTFIPCLRRWNALSPRVDITHRCRGACLGRNAEGMCGSYHARHAL